MKPNAYDLKRKIGVVFQDVAVFDELTVYDNIDYSPLNNIELCFFIALNI